MVDMNEVCMACGKEYRQHYHDVVGDTCLPNDRSSFFTPLAPYTGVNSPMTDKDVADLIAAKKGKAFKSNCECSRCGNVWLEHDWRNPASCYDAKLNALSTTFMPVVKVPAPVTNTHNTNSPMNLINGHIWIDHPGTYIPKNLKPIAKKATADIADWKTWRDVNRKSDECACGMKRELCDYHR